MNGRSRACSILSAGMRRLKFPILVAALISVLANAQCMVRCQVMPCDPPASSDVPPCHRHSAPAPKPCATPLIVADAQVHAAPQSVMQAAIVDTEVVPLTPWQPPMPPHSSSAPPDSGGPSINILRI